MAHFGTYGSVNVDLDDDFVATVELRQPPNNFLDQQLISGIVDAVEALGEESGCRAIVLCAQGKHFCAGGNFAPGGGDKRVVRTDSRHLYDDAVRLFRTRKPVVGAIQGAAVGGGLGLALWPDFRVAASEARFSANFSRLGFHQGFGLSVTLPRLCGMQTAMNMLYTGRRVPGEEALELGLCDALAPLAQLRERAHELAAEIAISAPLAVVAIRQTLRGELADQVKAATDHERIEQESLQQTADFKEGILAMAERRLPRFTGD